MSLYERHVVPWLTDLGCGSKPVRHQRRKVVPRARGRVLEVGAGSGHNFPYYEAGRVEHVFALEPSPDMRRRAAERQAAAAFPVEWLELPGEAIPLDDASVDTVLVTYTLCTIAAPEAALAQMRRVLRPGGTLIFCEHGRAPDPGVARWQDRVNPLWRRLAGGCNINRDIPALLRTAGFDLPDLETMYLPGTPRLFGFNFWGSAVAP